MRCNLHGACGGKGADALFFPRLDRCNLHGACGGKVGKYITDEQKLLVAICTERVEAKRERIRRA